MNDYNRGFTDNYAGVRRLTDKSPDWQAGWDAAQAERLKDEREIRRATSELQHPNQSHWAR